MKLKGFLLLTLLTVCSFAHAQDNAFSQAMNDLVSKGNAEYVRSHRQGIKLYADSIEHALQRRSAAGQLERMDSLVYTADVYKLRGDWHYENSNYDASSYATAETYFNKALAIYDSESAFNGDRRNAPMIHRELAQLYYKQQRYSEALEHTQVAYDAFAEGYDLGEFEAGDEDYDTYLDLKSQLAMCQARLGNTAEALQLMKEVRDEYPRTSQSYYEALRKQAKILMLSGKSGCEAEALPLYKQYLNWVRADALSTLGTMTAEEREGYWMRIRPFVADCYQTEKADPAFLYDVTLFSKGLLLQINRFSGRGKSSTQALQSLRYDYKQIQQKLAVGSCAIEFVQYEKSGRQCLAALVLKKTGKPTWVPMLSPDDFMGHQAYGRTNRERLYNTSGNIKNALYNDSAFYAEIWNADLLKAIRGCKKIYFAPDGYLHQVAIEYMLPDALSSADLYRLTSTRRLMESGRVRTDAALIVGGVQYNSATATTGTDNDSEAYDFLHTKRASFSYLKGSLTESDTIRLLRAAPKDSLLMGAAATEAAFRELCGQYPIVSISTHGYFGAAEVPQSTDVKTCLSDESMSQCILAMAGANTNLDKASFDAHSLDGILSARELSAIDMTDVDLVVVSACQTALGYITADGVYGIQRGLKNAGADCLLVSLWSVNDDATCLLMSRFHKNLRSGMTAHKAFKAARQSLLTGEATTDGSSKLEFSAASMTYEKAQTTTTYEEPMYSDAFIMIDAIE